MKVTVQSKQIQFVGEQLIPPLFYGNTHVLSNWEFLQLYGEFKTLENIGYRISLKLALWEAHAVTITEKLVRCPAEGVTKLCLGWLIAWLMAVSREDEVNEGNTAVCGWLKFRHWTSALIKKSAHWAVTQLSVTHPLKLGGFRGSTWVSV